MAKNEEKLWARCAGWHNLVHASQYQIHLLILHKNIFDFFFYYLFIYVFDVFFYLFIYLISFFIYFVATKISGNLN